MTNPFGLERLQRITTSGIRNVFTPFRPVRDIELLFDRENEVSRLVETTSTLGQHALIFGERGAGKSSLANAATVLLAPLREAARRISLRLDDRVRGHRSCHRAQPGTTRRCSLLLINDETDVRDGDIARRSAEASDVLRR